MGDYLLIEVPDGRFRAYVARPAASPAPIILVVQDVYGVTDEIRDACDELAACGYLAVSPDLYWRVEAGIELSDRQAAERERAFSLHQSFDPSAGMADIDATMHVARAQPESDGRYGMVAYSLGGLAAGLGRSGERTFVSLVHRRSGVRARSDRSSGYSSLLLIHDAEDSRVSVARASTV